MDKWRQENLCICVWCYKHTWRKKQSSIKNYASFVKTETILSEARNRGIDRLLYAHRYRFSQLYSQIRILYFSDCSLRCFFQFFSVSWRCFMMKMVAGCFWNDSGHGACDADVAFVACICSYPLCCLILAIISMNLLTYMLFFFMYLNKETTTQNKR